MIYTCDHNIIMIILVFTLPHNDSVAEMQRERGRSMQRLGFPDGTSAGRAMCVNISRFTKSDLRYCKYVFIQLLDMV